MEEKEKGFYNGAPTNESQHLQWFFVSCHGIVSVTLRLCSQGGCRQMWPCNLASPKLQGQINLVSLEGACLRCFTTVMKNGLVHQPSIWQLVIMLISSLCTQAGKASS